MGLPKKSLKKAVQQATIRILAERIAQDDVENSWQQIIGQARQANGSKAKDKQ